MLVQIGRPLLALLLIALAVSARAEDTASIAITQPWSRATPPGVTVGAAYFGITNKGNADTLLRVESPVAARVEMHTNVEKDGKMQMRPVPTVTVPAKGRLEFAPGGLHVMLIDLKQPLKEGARIPLTLVFEKSGAIHVEALVQGIGATSPPAANQGGHEHHHH